MRRSPREIKIEGKVVRRGDFLGYLLGDAHLNPEYYPEPHKYDPDRWLRPDPVPDTTFPFPGWGAGRHPCTGMKVAKLELKLISAMFLTRYEYELVDEHGKFLKECPVLDRNDLHQVCARTLEILHLALMCLPRVAPSGQRASSTSEKSRSRRVAMRCFERFPLDFYSWIFL